MGRSSVATAPPDVYIGPLKGAPEHVVQKLGMLSQSTSSTFLSMNGHLAHDIGVLYVPADNVLTQPVHVLYLQSGRQSQAMSAAPNDMSAEGVADGEGEVAPETGGDGAVAKEAGNSDGTATQAADDVADEEDNKCCVTSHPRLLVVLEAGAQAELIEEFSPLACGDTCLVNSVCELFLGDSSTCTHSIVQGLHSHAFSIKSTLVEQEKTSTYTVKEVSYGGNISRHDLVIKQLGPGTNTNMRHFMLCGIEQTNDLHSSLQLDHPRGQASQLHKSIVLHDSGHAVFDGKVKVSKLAQQTNAGQLSRNMLLARKGVVDAKPNLQIVADDVICTHGCTVSDLPDEQMFYLRQRGISKAEARKALVCGFGSEIVASLGHKSLTSRVQESVTKAIETDELRKG